MVNKSENNNIDRKKVAGQKAHAAIKERTLLCRIRNMVNTVDNM